MNKSMPDYDYHGSNRPVSMIMASLRNQWWNSITSTKPTYEPGMNWQTYEANVAKWEADLPLIASTFAKTLNTDKASHFGEIWNETYQYLSPAQKTALQGRSLLETLLAETTQEGYMAYQIENDTIYDAANRVWRATQWDPYWEMVTTVSQQDRARLDLAKDQFLDSHPAMNAKQLYDEIVKIYGPNRFTFRQVQKLLDEGPGDPYTTQERLDYGKSDIELAEEQIWAVLNWAGGSTGSDKLKKAYGIYGPQDDFNMWYRTEGTGLRTQPEELFKMRDNLLRAARDAKIPEPTRAELEQRVKVYDLNEEFKNWVTAELGSAFLRRSSAETGMPAGTLEAYYNMDYSSQAEWKKQEENKDEAKKIELYRKMREEFAKNNPLWAAYYTEYIPVKKQNLNFADTAAAQNSPVPEYRPNSLPVNATTRPSGAPMEYGGQVQTSEPTPAQDKQYVSKLSTITWPKGFRKAAGDAVANEIERLLYDGRFLSQPARDYLYDLAKRHREWRGFIFQILSK
jgi:hypothetical protein